MVNQIGFKGQIVGLDEDPKKHVCNRCRYVLGTVHPVSGKRYATTHMHHESYNPDDVLADTTELCPPCHSETESYGRPPTGKKPKTKNIKVTDEVHQQLGEIGRLTEDYGDVVERLLKFYKEHEQSG